MTDYEIRYTPGPWPYDVFINGRYYRQHATQRGAKRTIEKLKQRAADPDNPRVIYREEV